MAHSEFPIVTVSVTARDLAAVGWANISDVLDEVRRRLRALPRSELAHPSAVPSWTESEILAIVAHSQTAMIDAARGTINDAEREVAIVGMHHAMSGKADSRIPVEAVRGFDPVAADNRDLIKREGLPGVGARDGP